MIGFDSSAGIIKHYRVDRMETITITNQEREGQDVFEQHDMGLYTRQAFSMYGGKTQSVEMEFENLLAGVVMDRFGNDTIAITNGSTPVTNGQAATWAEGANTLTIVVTSGALTKTYTVTVTKS